MVPSREHPIRMGGRIKQAVKLKMGVRPTESRMQDKETLMTLDTQGDNAFLGGDAIDHIKHISLFKTGEGAELLNVFG